MTTDIFANANIVKGTQPQQDNTTVTSPVTIPQVNVPDVDIFAKAKKVSPSPISSMLFGGSPVDTTLGGTTTYSSYTDMYTVNPKNIMPLISMKEDPIISAMLKDDKQKKFLEQNWINFENSKGIRSTTSPFAEGMTLEEKIKIFDQNDGRILVFNTTDANNQNETQTIDFQAITDKYVYNLENTPIENLFTNEPIVPSSGEKDGKLAKVGSTNKNVYELVTHLRDNLNFGDEKLIAAMAKNEALSGSPLGIRGGRITQGALASTQFMAQTLLFGIGEVLPKVYTVPARLPFLGDAENALPQFEIGGDKITTMEGRGDILNRYVPTMAKLLKRNMLAQGIKMTEEQAESILAYSPTFYERGKKFTGEALPFLLPIGYLSYASRVKFGKEFEIFQKNNKFGTQGEAADAFIKEKANEKGLFNGLFRRIAPNLQKRMYEDRLVGADEIAQTKLPIADQRLYKQKLQELKELAFRIKKEKPKNMTLKDWKRDPRYMDITRELRKGHNDLNAIRLQGRVPKFLREQIGAESTVILFGTAAGGLFQMIPGLDETTGELIGIFAGVAKASKILPERFEGVTSLGLENIMRGSGNVILGALERVKFGRGYFLRDDSVYQSLDKGQIQQVEDIAKGFNTLDPVLREQVMQRVGVFFESRQALIDAGVSPELLSSTIAKVTGLATLELAEQSIKASIQAKETIDPLVIKNFQDIVDKRSRLTTELRQIAADLIPAASQEGDTVGIFAGNLDNLVTTMEKQSKELSEGINSVSNFLVERFLLELGDMPIEVKLDELTTSIKDIYRLSGVAIEAGPVVKTIDDIRATEQKINNEITRKIANIRNSQKKPSDFNVESIDNLLEIIAENRRISLQEQSKLLYKAIDRDFAESGARADAGRLFDEVMKYATSTSKGAFIVGNKTVSGRIANGLLQQFDNAALDAFNEFAGSKGASEDFMETITARMIDDFGYQKKDIRPSTILNFLQKEENIRLPVKLNYEEVQSIASGLRKEAFSKQRQLSPSAEILSTLSDNADSLFKEFKLPDGSDIGEELAARQKEADTFYKEQYADRAYEGTLGFEWLSYSRLPNPSNLEEAGKRFDKPITSWLNMDTIAKNEAGADNLGKKLKMFFGKQTKIGEVEEVNDAGEKIVKNKYNYQLTEDPTEGGQLGEVAKIKFVQWYAKQLKDGRNHNDLTDEMLNIQKTFEGSGFDPFDVIDQTGYFGFEQAKSRNKQIADLDKIAKLEADAVLNKQLKPAKDKLDEINNNIRWLQKNVDGLNTEESIFQFFVSRPEKDYIKLKEMALLTGKISEESFDETIKSIVGQRINNMVYKQTANKEILPNTPQLGSQIFDVDFGQLVKILGTDAQSGKNLKRILGDDHHTRLVNVAQFLALDQSKHAANVSLTGVPRPLSIESWISRVYAVNRNVISKRYVATEAAIQAARVNNFSIMQEMITNPEAAELFGKIILSGKPLTPEDNARIMGIIYTGIARVNARKDSEPLLKDFTGTVSNVANNIKNTVTKGFNNIMYKLK